jgi:hypothetical protein
MIWQKKNLALKWIGGLHVSPIKNLKENKKIKIISSLPADPTRPPPPSVMPVVGQPNSEEIADDRWPPGQAHASSPPHHQRRQTQ